MKKIIFFVFVFFIFINVTPVVFSQSFSLDGFNDMRALPNGFSLSTFNSGRLENQTERTFSIGVGFDRSNPSRMLLMIIYNDGSDITYIFESGFISDGQAIYLVRRVSPYSSQNFMGNMRRWKNEDFGGRDVSGIVSIQLYDGSGLVLVITGTLRNTPLGL
jgi:hypothetical protein